MLFVLPGDVCVDVTAQIKTQLKEWTWELARVAEGMKEWAVIFKVCPHSCPRLEKKTNMLSCEEFCKIILVYFILEVPGFKLSQRECVNQMYK